MSAGCVVLELLVAELTLELASLDNFDCLVLLEVEGSAVGCAGGREVDFDLKSGISGIVSIAGNGAGGVRGIGAVVRDADVATEGAGS